MYKNKKIFGIITARAGSKSFPNKNIKILYGKPLVYYSIKTSLCSNFIDKTLISTDSPKIAKIAKRYGCEVPFLRPKKYAKDFSSDFEVFLHLAKWLIRKKFLPDYFVHFRPTNPMRDSNIVDLAIKKIINNNSFDSLRSVSISNQTPYKMWFKKEKKLIPVIKHSQIVESFSQPRQKLPLVYWQNGYVDVIKSSTILKKKSVAGKKILAFLLNKETFDLDYPEDFLKIKKEFKSNLKKKKMKYLRLPN